MKQGYPLRAISAFDPHALRTLRDELSVTTAEEFLSVASACPGDVAGLLSIDSRTVDELAGAAAAALDTEIVEAILHPPTVDYPFRTGHDAPAAGRTFWNEG